MKKLEETNKECIKYPWGSNFIDWILKIANKYDLPIKEQETDSDFFELDIDGNSFGCDWKHLTVKDIEHASNCLKHLGFEIQCKDNPDNFEVELIPFNENYKKQKLESNYITLSFGDQQL